jgi:hypothetical protein
MNVIQIPYRDVAINQGFTHINFPAKQVVFPMDLYTTALHQTDFSTGDEIQTCLLILSEDVLSGEADRIATRILALAHDTTLRDEDEPSPSPAVVEQSTRLIREAANYVLGSMPPAKVAVFFGEVNVTWKSGNQVVRLAFFPDRPSVLQIGSLALPVGSYQSQPNPTPQLVAQRLNNLIKQDDPEDSPFPG